MNQFIEDRGTILAELGSLLTRFPELSAADIIVGAVVGAGLSTCDPVMNLPGELPDHAFAAGIKAYGDKLHEARMAAPLTRVEPVSPR